jgi:phosphotransferase system HPr-like phosphotransfer protein
LIIRANGVDESEALTKLETLINNKFQL